MLNERNPRSHDQFLGTFFSESWIIESGALDNMNDTLECLSDITVIAPIWINMADVRITTANRQVKVD